MKEYKYHHKNIYSKEIIKGSFNDLYFYVHKMM